MAARKKAEPKTEVAPEAASPLDVTVDPTLDLSLTPDAEPTDLALTAVSFGIVIQTF